MAGNGNVDRLRAARESAAARGDHNLAAEIDLELTRHPAELETTAAAAPPEAADPPKAPNRRR